MKIVLLILVAGGLGALARHGLGGLVQDLAGPAFPWGTFVVNVAGCFLFGLVWGVATERDLLTPEVRAVALTGFMGAFTTFSTFAFDVQRLVEEGRVAAAAANVAGQVALGLAAMFLGLALGRTLG